MSSLLTCDVSSAICWVLLLLLLATSDGISSGSGTVPVHLCFILDEGVHLTASESGFRSGRCIVEMLCYCQGCSRQHLHNTWGSMVNTLHERLIGRGNIQHKWCLDQLQLLRGPIPAACRQVGVHSTLLSDAWGNQAHSTAALLRHQFLLASVQTSAHST